MSKNWNDIVNNITSVTINADNVIENNLKEFTNADDKLKAENVSHDVDAIKSTLNTAHLTDEKIKMDANDASGYLADKIDSNTLKVIANKLVASKLENMTATVEQINYLVGLTDNVQKQIDNLVNVTSLHSVVDTEHQLPTTPIANRSVILVRADSGHGGNSAFYISDGATMHFVSIIEHDVARDFSINPINLTNEVTGVLPKSHMSPLTGSDIAFSPYGQVVSTNIQSALNDTIDKTVHMIDTFDINARPFDYPQGLSICEFTGGQGESYDNLLAYVNSLMGWQEESWRIAFRIHTERHGGYAWQKITGIMRLNSYVYRGTVVCEINRSTINNSGNDWVNGRAYIPIQHGSVEPHNHYGIKGAMYYNYTTNVMYQCTGDGSEKFTRDNWKPLIPQPNPSEPKVIFKNDISFQTSHQDFPYGITYTVLKDYDSPNFLSYKTVIEEKMDYLIDNGDVHFRIETLKTDLEAIQTIKVVLTTDNTSYGAEVIEFKRTAVNLNNPEWGSQFMAYFPVMGGNYSPQNTIYGYKGMLFLDKNQGDLYQARPQGKSVTNYNWAKIAES